jgi:hypothetical protein
VQIDGSRQHRDQQRFGQTRYTLQQQMTTGEQCDEAAFDDHVLTDDHFADASANGVEVADYFGNVRSWLR